MFEELTSLVDPGKKAYRPKKGRSNVIMFVGNLQTSVLFFKGEKVELNIEFFFLFV